MAETRKMTRTPKTSKAKPVDEYGHLQPQAPELEEAVLGALMIEKDAYSLVSEILRPESFYERRHQLIYSAITSLALRQQPVDILTVAEQLRKHQIGAAGVRLFVGTVVEERVHRLLRQMRHHPGDGVAHAVEVGRNVLIILARLAELGRGDQVHGVRDLHGVLNALNALFQQLTGRHGCRLPHMLSRRSGWHRPHRVRACRWR